MEKLNAHSIGFLCVKVFNVECFFVFPMNKKHNCFKKVFDQKGLGFLKCFPILNSFNTANLAPRRRIELGQYGFIDTILRGKCF